MGNTPSELLGGAEPCTCKLQPYLGHRLVKGKKVKVQMSPSEGSGKVLSKTGADDCGVPLRVPSSSGRKCSGKGRRRSFSLGEGRGASEAEEVLLEISSNKLGKGMRLSSPNPPDNFKVVTPGASSTGVGALSLSSCNLSSIPHLEPPDDTSHTSSRDIDDVVVRGFESFSLISNEIDDKATEEVQEELPKGVVYYGWFLSPEVSSSVSHMVMHLFREGFNQVGQFQKFILTCCKDDDVKDPFEYYGYKRPGKRIKPDAELAYHVTAKFLGRSPDPPYQSLAHSFLDKEFRIRLIGIVFTPRTLCVRVKLTPGQQLIFDEKDDEKSGTSPVLQKPGDFIIKQLQNELDSYSWTDKEHKKQAPNCKMKPDKDGVNYKLSATSTSVPASRAHITIGCARNVLPKQAGDDLVDIVDLEQRPTTRKSNFQQDFQVKGYGSLRQFAKHAEAFVFYPSYEMIVPGRWNFYA